VAWSTNTSPSYNRMRKSTLSPPFSVLSYLRSWLVGSTHAHLAHTQLFKLSIVKVYIICGIMRARSRYVTTINNERDDSSSIISRTRNFNIKKLILYTQFTLRLYKSINITKLGYYHIIPYIVDIISYGEWY
jgi:hypothetical protein